MLFFFIVTSFIPPIICVFTLCLMDCSVLISTKGTIGILSSDIVHRIIGIDIEQQAVDDAQHNACLNGNHCTPPWSVCVFFTLVPHL